MCLLCHVLLYSSGVDVIYQSYSTKQKNVPVQTVLRKSGIFTSKKSMGKGKQKENTLKYVLNLLKSIPE